MKEAVLLKIMALQRELTLSQSLNQVNLTRATRRAKHLWIAVYYLVIGCSYEGRWITPEANQPAWGLSPKVLPPG